MCNDSKSSPTKEEVSKVSEEDVQDACMDNSLQHETVTIALSKEKRWHGHKRRSHLR